MPSKQCSENSTSSLNQGPLNLMYNVGVHYVLCLSCKFMCPLYVVVFIALPTTFMTLFLPFHSTSGSYDSNKVRFWTIHPYWWPSSCFFRRESMAFASILFFLPHVGGEIVASVGERTRRASIVPSALIASLSDKAVTSEQRWGEQKRGEREHTRSINNSIMTTSGCCIIMPMSGADEESVTCGSS